MKSLGVLGIALFCITSSSFQTAFSTVLNPRQTVESNVAKLQEILGNKTLNEERKYALLKQAAFSALDMEEISRRVLRSWRYQTEADRQEFTALFTELIERAYFNRIKDLESALILYQGDKIEGDFAKVRTEVQLKDNDKISLDYSLINKGGVWKIYDVQVMGISLVANYRSQFSAILTRQSFEQLLETLREKITEFKKNHKK